MLYPLSYRGVARILRDIHARAFMHSRSGRHPEGRANRGAAGGLTCFAFPIQNRAMNWGCRPSRRTAIAAIFAIVVNALAPTLSHALAANRAMGEIDLCSASGPGFARAADEPRAQDQPRKAPQLALEHCAYCLAHAASVALEPPAPWMVAAAAAAPPCAHAGGIAIVAVAARFAQPRAPPAHS